MAAGRVRQDRNLRPGLWVGYNLSLSRSPPSTARVVDRRRRKSLEEHMAEDSTFIALEIAILTVSDSRSEENDTSGRTLVERLTDAGHRLADKRIVPDDIYAIRAAVSSWIADPGVQAVITTGGTGVTGRDGTPEAVEVLLDKQIEGFGEIFRMLSWQEIQTSTIQSRALAGVANGTYIFCVPGSSGACRTAWDGLIKHQLDHRTRPCNLVQLLPRLREG
jgi:molybdenum cofactor biosynthesis protein B